DVSFHTDRFVPTAEEPQPLASLSVGGEGHSGLAWCPAGNALVPKQLAEDGSLTLAHREGPVEQRVVKLGRGSLEVVHCLRLQQARLAQDQGARRDALTQPVSST